MKMQLAATLSVLFLYLPCEAAAPQCPKGFGIEYCDHLKKSSGSQRQASGVYLTWMGVAGFMISDGDTLIFVDPFLTRPNVSKVMFRDPLKPDQEAIRHWLGARGVNKADAIFVSHTHYDHALDAPFFAQETGADLYGSQSTLNTIGKQLESGRAHLIEAGRTVKIGQFKITARESEHGKIFLGRVPFPGKIAQPVSLPAAASDYLMGEVYSLLIEHPKGKLLHHASAGWKADTFKDWQAAVVLLGIAGRSSTTDLYENVVKKVSAQSVYPMHFDNFFRPLDQELKLSWGVDFPEFMKTAQTFEPGIRVETLPIGETICVF